MSIKVGTFNLNNLFSRFNFQGAVDAIQDTQGAAGSITIRYEFTDPSSFRIRTFLGKLVKAKDIRDTEAISNRILTMDLDVLAVQEVENIEILKEFNRDNLGNIYPHQVLIEGNDPRFIDVGILSKLPIGAVTSWQTAVHNDLPNQRVFGRDLLEVEIFNAARTKKLLTLYNNHLKSQFVPFDEDPVQGKRNADARRKRQAETIARIVASRTRPDSRYVLLGDFNDTPNAPTLAPMQSIEGAALANALTNPTETRPPKADNPPAPLNGSWTHRFKPSGEPARYELFDQIWLSPKLAERDRDAFIDRRTKHGGDGSDHDPAWIEIDI